MNDIDRRTALTLLGALSFGVTFLISLLAQLADSPSGLIEALFHGIGSFVIAALVGVIGGRVQFDREMGEVRVTPRVRIEYSHEFAAVDPQRIRYADWLDGASYQLVGDAWATDRVTLGVGSGLGFENGWSLDLDLGGELAKRQSSATARIGAAKRF